jgi:hypothetical protein
VRDENIDPGDLGYKSAQLLMMIMTMAYEIGPTELQL